MRADDNWRRSARLQTTTRDSSSACAAERSDARDEKDRRTENERLTSQSLRKRTEGERRKNAQKDGKQGSQPMKGAARAPVPLSLFLSSALPFGVFFLCRPVSCSPPAAPRAREHITRRSFPYARIPLGAAAILHADLVSFPLDHDSRWLAWPGKLRANGVCAPQGQRWLSAVCRPQTSRECCSSCLRVWLLGSQRTTLRRMRGKSCSREASRAALFLPV